MADRLFASSRVAFLIGFGRLLEIMVLAGIDALRVLQQFRQSDETIRRRYLSHQFDGSCYVDSTPGGGIILSVELPFEKELQPQ